MAIPAYRKKRTYEASEIRYKLETDDYWLCRGLAAIYKFHKHKETLPTYKQEGLGFTFLDARDLVPLAELYLQRKALTPAQLRVARPKMLKYAGQLARIANGLQKMVKHQSP